MDTYEVAAQQYWPAIIAFVNSLGKPAGEHPAAVTPIPTGYAVGRYCCLHACKASAAPRVSAGLLQQDVVLRGPHLKACCVVSCACTGDAELLLGVPA
jgi:hypothetical protein